MKLMFKVLGLALVAIAMLSAAAASSALAVEAEFKVSKSTEFMEIGEGAEVFTTDIGEVECSTYTAKGTTPEFESTPTLTTTSVEYGGCEVLGLPATVNSNGCNYTYHAGTKTPEGSEGSVDIVCPTGKSITVVASGCTVTIPPQGPKVHIKYTNFTTASGRMDVRRHKILTSVSYSWSGLLCGSGSATDGTVVGTTIQTTPGADYTVG